MRATERWERLFDDMDGQGRAAQAAALAAEVADRTRIEQSTIRLVDRLTAVVGHPITVHLVDGDHRRGQLVDVAAQWVLLGGAAPVLVPTAAISGVDGLTASSATTGSRVLRRLSLASALRAVSRDRSPVRVSLGHGSRLEGTVDAVGSDHLDLAVHPADEPRRVQAVRCVRVVPFAVLVVVQPASGTSSLEW